MRTKDLVSVLIPAYNHESYIQDCIQSVIAQDYDNIELLVVDDGSSDQTMHKLLELRSLCEERFERCFFVKQKNQGVALTLNRLIDLSKGDYIFILASDDVVKSTCISRLVSFLQNNLTFVLAVGDNEIINDKSERIYWDKSRRAVGRDKATYLTFGDFLGINALSSSYWFGNYFKLLERNHIPNGYLIRKSSVECIGKYDPDLKPEDWYLNIKLAKVGRFKYFNEILFSYRWHSTNTVKSYKFILKSWLDRRAVLKHEKSWCLSENQSKHWTYCWRSDASLLTLLRIVLSIFRDITRRFSKCVLR